MTDKEILNRIKSLIGLLKAEKGINQKALAEELQVSENTISAWKEKSIPSFKHLFLLRKKFKVNLTWLLGGIGDPFEETAHSIQNDTDFIMIPIVNAILSAGTENFEIDGNVDRHFIFRRDFLEPKGSIKDMVLMKVPGNSMEPEIKENDTILIDQSQIRFMANGIYAVALQSIIYLKQINAMPDKILLESINKNYPPVIIEPCNMDSVRILGRAIWWCREVL